MDAHPRCGICHNDRLEGTASECVGLRCDFCTKTGHPTGQVTVWSGLGYRRACGECYGGELFDNCHDCCVCQATGCGIKKLTVVVGACERSVRFACSSEHLAQAEATLWTSMHRARGFCRRCDLNYSENPDPGDIVELETEELLRDRMSWLDWRSWLYALGFLPHDYVSRKSRALL